MILLWWNEGLEAAGLISGFSRSPQQQKTFCNLFSLITFLDFKPEYYGKHWGCLLGHLGGLWNHIYRKVHLVLLFRRINFLRSILFQVQSLAVQGFVLRALPLHYFRPGFSLILLLSVQALALTVNFFMSPFSSNFEFCVSLCSICL